MLQIINKSSDDVEKKKQAPHLAITSTEFGGAANQRNVSLLLKSTEEMTPEVKELLKSILVEEVLIEKASYGTKRKMLEEAVKKFNNREYDYSWVVDFDDEYVVFATQDGMFYSTYSMDGEYVQVGDTASPVEQIISYQESSGKVIMTEGDINKNVQSLIVKSFDKISSNEKVLEILKSKKEKESLMEKELQELQKSHDTLKQELETIQKSFDAMKAEKEEVVKERDVLKSTLADIEKAQAELKAQKRQEVVKSVISDEKEAEEFLKSMEAVEDGVFDTVIKALKTKQELVEQSPLFKQVSKVSGEDGEQEDHLTQLLKSKYNKQQ